MLTDVAADLVDAILFDDVTQAHAQFDLQGTRELPTIQLKIVGHVVCFEQMSRAEYFGNGIDKWRWGEVLASAGLKASTSSMDATGRKGLGDIKVKELKS